MSFRRKVGKRFSWGPPDGFPPCHAGTESPKIFAQILLTFKNQMLLHDKKELWQVF
jgi:hypothetical protein